MINTALTSTRRRKGTLAVLAGYAAKQKAADTARTDLVSAEKTLSPVAVEFAKVETVLAKAKQELVNAGDRSKQDGHRPGGDPEESDELAGRHQDTGHRSAARLLRL